VVAPAASAGRFLPRFLSSFLDDLVFFTALNKVKKAEPSFRFKGNKVQIELNAEISGNTNAVLSELGRNNVRKAVMYVFKTKTDLRS
jgi:hypothetical protein